MQSHAEQVYPEECCGVMFGKFENEHKVLINVKPLENAWTPEAISESEENSAFTKKSRYWIDPKDLLIAMQTARQQNLDIIGIYHSHPDHPSVPSECDRSLAWSQYSYIILSVNQGKTQDWHSWQLDENQQFQKEEIIIV